MPEPELTKENIKKFIGLGTLNPKIIDKFFYDMKLKAYDYDYLIQEELVDLSSFRNSFYECFTRACVVQDGARDGYQDKVCLLQIDKSIIHYSRRKEYLVSKDFNKPHTLDEIIKNRDMFKFGILCFINGKLDLNFRVHAKEDKTLIYFLKSNYAATIKEDDVIDTVFIPESVIYTSRTLSQQDKYESNGINDTCIPNVNRDFLAECKGFIAYMTPKDQPNSIFYTDVTYDVENGRFTFSTNLPTSIDGYTLTVIGMESYSQSLDFTPTTKYLQIDKKKMPIPKNNLLIMVRDSNGYSYHVNTGEITIKEYYPYIYEILNPNRLTGKIVVLYKDNPQNELIDYDIQIGYYLSKINLLERYNKATIPNGMREYRPIKWDYSIKDYADNCEIDTPTEDEWYPFLYKMSKISSWYKLWCLFFQTYLRRTYGFLDGWTLDISTIDLSERARTTTNPELPITSGKYQSFEHPQYLFTYKNEYPREDDIPYAWFIDGVFSVPTYSVAYKGYQYVYFDQALIKENSFMDVERYDGNRWSQKLYLGTGTTEVTLNKLQMPILANTIFMTDNNCEYIDNSKFKVTTIDESLGGYEYDLDLDNSIYVLKPGTTIKITPLSTDIMNKNVILHCNNRAIVFDVKVTGVDEYGRFDLNNAGNIIMTKKNLLPRVRLYNTEGRMFPKYAYKTYGDEVTNAQVPQKITLDTTPAKGTVFKVEYMGYDEKLVYELDEIPLNGLVLLEGKLDKPFSLVYHDVFLNGYKLNKSQIEIIAPFAIVIKNVRTIKKLMIYERVKGEEPFRFETGEESQYLPDRLLDEDDEYYDKIIDELPDIDVDPSIPDIDDDIDVTLGLILDFILVNFVNADEKYPPEIFEPYSTLFPGDQWRLLFNADDRKNYNIPSTNWYYLSHDLNIKYNKK